MSLLGFDHIRLATPADEDRLFDFLMLLHGENALFPVSDSKVREIIRQGTLQQGGVIGIIDGADGSIEASVGLIVDSWWYTNAPSLNERWNFVRQDCRHSPHAKNLIQFSKRAAQHLGVPLIMGIISTRRTEAKVRLYKRQMEYVGGYFMSGHRPAALDDGKS
jgi:N-acetylglutamate synthase-like GNAT family acetyltransferase